MICFGIAEFKIQDLTELPAQNTSVFSFLDDNFSKYQWIFTKLGMYIDIVEICFGIANGRFLSIFDRVICPPQDNGGVLSFHVLFSLTDLHWTLSKYFLWKTFDAIRSLVRSLFRTVRIVKENWECCRLAPVSGDNPVTKYSYNPLHPLNQYHIIIIKAGHY